eukprot:TRINITY_DN367_c0_g1_i1.p1 TRINITY_DN367_c0_g1~~TRINITY_DN367_c0_g1_i1.p1  ORF type:complete len:404 (+),score=65.30 TRINITY_DN367_c0_g1_i1:113-1324(+)
MEERHPLAKRTQNLGTETAFAVSLEAEKLRSTGQRIYPFHIGDLNFKSPDCVIKAMNQAIADGRTGYCAGAGILPLRTRLAEWVGTQRGCTYGPENVSVQSGGKPVIGKFLAAVMEEGDEVLYPSPGYPIYESQISFLGGVKVPYTFKEAKDGFAFDLPYLRSLITKKTKVFIYNNYSNPMGIASSDEEMAELAQMCVEHDLIVLSDEAYFDLVYDNKPSKSIAALPGMQERTVILYTYSKSYAMTGWRLGAAIGPVHIINMINKFNTNDESCTTQFIQYAGIAALSEEGKAYTQEVVQVLAQRRDTLVQLINAVPGFHCHSPQAAFYLFVNVTGAMQKLGITQLEQFRRHVLENTGVAFCTREHFGAALPTDTQQYVRFAYSGIDLADIIECGTVLKDFFSK